MTAERSTPIIPGPRTVSLPVAGHAAQPPPFILPAAHFTASLVWLTLGAIGLVAVAPRLAEGGFLDPRVFAVVHVFTLGVVTTAIFGALYQLFPPLLGVTLRSTRVALASFWLLTIGAAVLVAGFWTWQRLLLGTGWMLIFGAVGGVSWNLLPQRRRARQGHLVGRYISAGHAALGLAMLLGAARIGELFGWWTTDRLGMISAHFHLAALGFATFTAVGVGSRVLPMFLLARDPPQRPLRWIGPLGGAGLVTLSVGQMFGWRGAVLGGASLTASAGAMFLALAAAYYRRREHRALDPALAHVAVALLGLALTLGTGLALLFLQGAPLVRGTIAYALLGVLGWLVLLIIGVYYRILPFLTWLNLAPRRPAATLSAAPPALLRRDLAWWSLGLLAGGIGGMVAGVFAGTTGGVRGGAILFAAGVGVLVAQYGRMLVRVRRGGATGQ